MYFLSYSTRNIHYSLARRNSGDCVGHNETVRTETDRIDWIFRRPNPTTDLMPNGSFAFILGSLKNHSCTAVHARAPRTFHRRVVPSLRRHPSNSVSETYRSFNWFDNQFRLFAPKDWSTAAAVLHTNELGNLCETRSGPVRPPGLATVTVVFGPIYTDCYDSLGFCIWNATKR